MSGYISFERNVELTSQSIAHGGVAILACPFLRPKRITLNTRLQAIAVEIFLFRPIKLCSIYIQEIDNVTQQELQDLINQLEPHFILAGDMNGHSPLWGHESTSHLGRIIEETFIDNGLILLNDDSPTYLN